MSSGMIGSLGLAGRSLQQAGENGVLQQAKADVRTDNKSRIEKASQQFEAMLLGTWLKEAEQSFSVLPGGDDSDAAQQQMMSLGVQSLAQSMAANGGIGIGKMIAHAMEAAAARETAASAGSEHLAEKGKSGQKL